MLEQHGKKWTATWQMQPEGEKRKATFDSREAAIEWEWEQLREHVKEVNLWALSLDKLTTGSCWGQDEHDLLARISDELGCLLLQLRTELDGRPHDDEVAA